MRREQLTHEKLDALLRMISEDGVTASGEAPPPEYIDEIRSVAQLGDAEKIAVAHCRGVDASDALDEVGPGQE